MTLKFEEMQAKIRKPPKNIEELSDLKDYMSILPMEIEKEKKEIKRCMQIYDILDLEEYMYVFTNPELDMKWNMFGGPRETLKMVTEQAVILEKTKEQMIKEMEEGQKDFEENLNSNEGAIAGFSSYDEMDKYQEIYKNVESMNQKLKECLDLAMLYNKREQLVGKPPKDYSRLTQMVKEFTPYSNLWTTTKVWHEKHKHWLECPWEELNALELEDITLNSFKTMQKTLAFFKTKDFPKITAIA